MEKQWLFDRCREVQESPDGNLDLWAREHYKSTIITFGLTIKDILNDPELTVGIFSHTRPIAKQFLRQIKREFEANNLLKSLFPEILWQDPHKEAPKWSEDEGIVVRRKGNPKESTVEAWGLVDGQPTSKHFRRMVYDDVVTRESVTTPEMIAKVTEAWELSRNLAAEGGTDRHVGTRYHFNDTYKSILERGFKPRIYPATVDGAVEGEPVLMSRETLDKKRREQGPYTFACHARGTMVLMADWRERPIEDVAVGDMVIGWTMPAGKRARLVPTRVLAKASRVAPIIALGMESGRWVHCTPDHNWYTGRRPGGAHKTYLPASSIDALIPLYDSGKLRAHENAFEAGYLAGIFDGEGSVSSGTLHIAQSEEVNPHICERIRYSLKALGFEWSECRPAGRPQHIDFSILGGREEKMRFLHQCAQAKAPRIIQSLFERATRGFGKALGDKVRHRQPQRDGEVWNIQTETGNYFAGGYASKNCQMLQDPVADRVQGFKREWLRHYEGGAEGNKYMLVDAASEKKEGSDYTAIWVVALSSDGNYYALDIVRDRMNLTERANRVMELHRKHKPMEVRYEKYGLMADVEYLKTIQAQQNYRFDIVEVGGTTPKNDRIRRLIPIFEQGKFYLPQSLYMTDYEGIPRDMVRSFVEEEYLPFPVAVHDDMFDALARLCDGEGRSNGQARKLELVWPMPSEDPTKPMDRYARKQRQGKSAWAA